MLPVVKNKRSDNIYIKMSFRGKSLTLFENFKAHFETLPNSTCLAHADDRAFSCGRFSARDFSPPSKNRIYGPSRPRRGSGHLYLVKSRPLQLESGYQAHAQRTSRSRHKALGQRVQVVTVRQVVQRHIEFGMVLPFVIEE